MVRYLISPDIVLKGVLKTVKILKIMRTEAAKMIL